MYFHSNLEKNEIWPPYLDQNSDKYIGVILKHETLFS